MDDMDEGDGWFPTEQELADIKRADQDIWDGFSYTTLSEESGRPGSWRLRCDKCGRIGDIMDRPFPHRYGCPVRELDAVILTHAMRKL